MMIVGDEKKPTEGTPSIDQEYGGPALAPAEDAPEEPEVAAEPEGESPPADETPSGLKVPDEYAQSEDDLTDADLKALGLKTDSETELKKTVDGVEGYLLKIENASGDVEEAAGLLVFELDKADVGAAQKKLALARLVNVHNGADSTDAQKEAVVHAFDLIMTESSNGLFSQAMLASAKLSDECAQLTEYVKGFATRVHEDGDKAYKGESHAAFLKAASILAEKDPEGTKVIISGFINMWFEKPSTKSLWNALMAIADTEAIYAIEAEEGKVDVTMKEAVRKRFMGEYRDLTEEEQADIAGSIVLAMGEEVPTAHVDIICQMIRKGPDTVRAEILNAVEQLDAMDRSGEIEVDHYAMKACYTCLADQAEEGCFTDDGGNCDALVDSLHEGRMRYADLLDFSVGMSAHNLVGLAGEPMGVSTPGIGYNLEWMSSESSNGMRLLLGANYMGWVDRHSVGVSVGTAYTSGKFYVKLAAAVNYLYVKDVEDGLDDVPVELSDPQITADGTAYRMSPHEMDFVMNAAVLMLKPEIGYVFHRWDVGEGKTLGLKGFLGLHAGLFAGNVYDDGCSYSYDPAGDDVIHVSPAGDGSASVVQETDLGTRCRSGKPVFGTIFGVQAGLAVEFGL